MLIKAFLLLCLLAGVIHGLTESNPGTDNEFEACWERCYQKADESTQMRHYQLAYAGLYDMGMEARRLKNLRSVNGTVILMDGTLHMHHNPSHNANLMESETAEAIWHFQRNLATITVHMLGADNTRNPLSIVQFNERGAVTCDSFTCMDQCQVHGVMRSFMSPNTDVLVPIQTNATSHHDGMVEPACRIGYYNLHSSTTCTKEIDREMAIAFYNSDFHSNVHESDEWDDYSPCDEHFDTRYAIGTHAAHHMKKLKKWSSLDAHPIYVKDDVYYMEAAETLAQCMGERCCSTTSDNLVDDSSTGGQVTPVTITSCMITDDHFGEMPAGEMTYNTFSTSNLG